MTISLSQVMKWGAFSGASGVTTQAITPTSAFLAGDIAIVGFTFDTGKGVPRITCSDPTNGQYSFLGILNDTVHGQCTGLFAKGGLLAGQPSVTVTYSGGGVNFPANSIAVISGAVASGAIGNILCPRSNVGQIQQSPGTGTDAATSGTPPINITGINALIIELCIASSSAATPTAGTGFSSSSSGWLSGINLATFAAKRVTTFGAYPGTFTMGANGTTCTFAAAFLELGATPDGSGCNVGPVAYVTP